jgi:hypothetical protein
MRVFFLVLGVTCENSKNLLQGKCSRFDVDQDSPFGFLAISKILLASTPFLINDFPFLVNFMFISITVLWGRLHWPEFSTPKSTYWKLPEWQMAERRCPHQIKQKRCPNF